MNDVLTVEQLFSERLFLIPAYQRGYAWETAHRFEFIQDIELLAEGKEHYTGTVVLHGRVVDRVNDDEGRSYRVYDVVDGQQRLTSTVLLLDALQREFAAIEGKAKFADGIRKAYVAANGFDGQPLFRLRLNPDCREFWEDVVLAPKPSPTAPSIQSHERLSAGQREFRDYLARQRVAQGENWASWALGMYRKVTQQLRFSLYEVGNATEVGVIFEVMNNRGKPLSELEKVKNYLLYLAAKLDVPGHDLGERVNRAWADIFENLMAAGLTSPHDENQVLRTHWIVVYDHDRRNWDGSRSVKARFPFAKYAQDHKRLLEDLLAYTRSLRDVALAYSDAARPSRPEAFKSFGAAASDIQHISDKLLRMNILAPFLPILVAVRLRFAADPAKYRVVVDFCERFAFRVYKLVQKRSNAGQSMLFLVAHQIYHGGTSYESALVRLYGLLLHHCSDDKLREEMEYVADWYGWRSIRYFLYEYEEHLAGKNAVKVSWAEIERRDLDKTIEHILPQTPSDPYWKERFDAAQRRKWTDDIGNLVLTSHNSTYWCHAFPVKRGKPGQEKPCYVTSNLFQERALGEFSNWTPVNLEKRRKAIVAWALTRWAVPPEFATIDDEADDEEDDDVVDEFVDAETDGEE
jgi:hypothetical protein